MSPSGRSWPVVLPWFGGYGRRMTDLIDDLLVLRTQIESGDARRIREHAGLSAATLARQLDVTPAAVTRWEQGTRYPRGANARRYARLLRRLAALAV